jgi:long-chain acyl-CoA synthetase
MQLLDRFISICREQPDALAVVQGSEQWSYHDLGMMCANIAHFLLDGGVSRDDRVAIVLKNSAQYIAVYYGIWASGGVTVALNTQAKSRDIENWIRHSEAKWLFIDEDHPELANLSALKTLAVRIVPVAGKRSSHASQTDSDWQTICSTSCIIPDAHAKAENLASIIYTSGTTGHPKGVMLSHGNLTANIESILAYLQITNSDSIVNVLPFYYSYGNSILHTHIVTGARLVLENSLLFPHRVVERIATEHVTGFSGVPSTFSLILGRVNLSTYDFANLRYVTQAGGPMPPVLIDKLKEALPEVNFFVMYGQTEATARLTYLNPEKLISKRGSIGKAIPGVKIEIRDKMQKPVKPGESGEICASGQNIMQGYWKDPAKTSSVIKDGWLHTGDLAHYDRDGYIYIDGRSSDMIKSGGNRISPKEVEEVIQELSGVLEVAVVGIPDDLLGETIKAFIVPTPNSGLDKRAIKFHCKDKLASYKIPKTIAFIKELPKTASGKVQRFQLQNSAENNNVD